MGVRRINAESKELLKRLEGLKLEAYQDSGGVWTIGYGTTRDVTPGLHITQGTAEHLLDMDLLRFERCVSEAVRVDLSDNQFGALVIFAYNVGEQAFKTSTLLRKLNDGLYEEVPAQLARWNKVRVNGKLERSQGLANRRAAEAGLWARGSFAAGREVQAVAPSQPGVQTAANVGMASTVGVLATALPHLTGLDWRVGLGVVVVAALLACLYYWRKADR
jgi:lysozyme